MIITCNRKYSYVIPLFIIFIFRKIVRKTLPKSKNISPDRTLFQGFDYFLWTFNVIIPFLFDSGCSYYCACNYQVLITHLKQVWHINLPFYFIQEICKRSQGDKTSRLNRK